MFIWSILELGTRFIESGDPKNMAALSGFLEENVRLFIETYTEGVP